MQRSVGRFDTLPLHGLSVLHIKVAVERLPKNNREERRKKAQGLRLSKYLPSGGTTLRKGYASSISFDG